MVQLVFNEVDIRENKNWLWSIFLKKEETKKIDSKVAIKPYESKETNYIKIADFDTFISMNGKHESQIVQNAIEQGKFRSVNKIRKPNVCSIELGKGGDSQDVQLVLENLKKYKESTDLLMIYTPFGVLENMNLIGLDYSFGRGENASMLIAKLTLQEVQTVGKVVGYTTETVKNPEDTNIMNLGEKALRRYNDLYSYT